MVFLTADWQRFKEYIDFCRTGTYQIKETVDGIELRIRAGKLGMIANFMASFVEKEGSKEKDLQFADPKAELLFNEMLESCRLHGFIEVLGVMADDTFHL